MNIGAEYTSNGKYNGGTFAIGYGTSLPEGHGEISKAKVIDITGILKFFDIYDEAIDFIKDGFNSLSDEQKEFIKEKYDVSF